MTLTREKILQSRKAKDFEKVRVDTPEWAANGDDPSEAYVYVRVLSGRERDSWEQSLAKGQGRKVEADLDNIRAKLAAAAVCDENGAKLFSPTDIAALGELHCAPLQRIFDEAMRINRMTPEHIEELTKNSPSAPGTDSFTDSAGT